MSPLDFSRLVPSYDPHFAHFPSRRSTVFSAKGAVATSQPLGMTIAHGRAHPFSVSLIGGFISGTPTKLMIIAACQAGIEILNKGGNAGRSTIVPEPLTHGLLSGCSRSYGSSDERHRAFMYRYVLDSFRFENH